MQRRTDGLRLAAGALALCALGLIASGCTEKPGGPLSPDREPDRVSYAGDIVPLLNRCLTCHGNPGNSNFSVRSYESLFIPGIQASSRGLLPVKAGDPDSSYMVWKLAGRGPQGEPIQGTRMPQSGAPLTPGEQEILRTWIAEGALDN
jgi:hypothetical protein